MGREARGRPCQREETGDWTVEERFSVELEDVGKSSTWLTVYHPPSGDQRMGQSGMRMREGIAGCNSAFLSSEVAEEYFRRGDRA